MLSQYAATLQRANADYEALLAEGAPQDVLGAAKGTIQCVRLGLQPPSAYFAILQRHAAIRSAQNRFGKLLGEA